MRLIVLCCLKAWRRMQSYCRPMCGLNGNCVEGCAVDGKGHATTGFCGSWVRVGVAVPCSTLPQRDDRSSLMCVVPAGLMCLVM